MPRALSATLAFPTSPADVAWEHWEVGAQVWSDWVEALALGQLELPDPVQTPGYEQALARWARAQPPALDVMQHLLGIGGPPAIDWMRRATRWSPEDVATQPTSAGDTILDRWLAQADSGHNPFTPNIQALTALESRHVRCAVTGDHRIARAGCWSDAWHLLRADPKVPIHTAKGTLSWAKLMANEFPESPEHRPAQLWQRSISALESDATRVGAAFALGQAGAAGALRWACRAWGWDQAQLNALVLPEHAAAHSPRDWVGALAFAALLRLDAPRLQLLAEALADLTESTAAALGLETVVWLAVLDSAFRAQVLHYSTGPSSDSGPESKVKSQLRDLMKPWLQSLRPEAALSVVRQWNDGLDRQAGVFRRHHIARWIGERLASLWIATPDPLVLTWVQDRFEEDASGDLRLPAAVYKAIGNAVLTRAVLETPLLDDPRRVCVWQALVLWLEQKKDRGWPRVGENNTGVSLLVPEALWAWLAPGLTSVPMPWRTQLAEVIERIDVQTLERDVVLSDFASTPKARPATWIDLVKHWKPQALALRMEEALPATPSPAPRVRF